MQPIAYIRKSRVNPHGPSLSWEVQEAHVRDLAARNGDAESLTILSDWGASGAAATGLGSTGRGGRRKVWAQLVAMIEGHQVSALYAYSLSRLARSTRELLDLAERCAATGVVVRLAKEGTLDFTSAHGRLYLTVLAAVATFEADVSAERARDHVAVRRGRGDHIGQPPYGYMLVDGRLEPDPGQPLEPILEAYREAGTYHGAARILNAQGLNTRGDTRWSDMTVRRVVARSEGADHRPAKRGRPAAQPALLAGVLRCHCGGPMSPSRHSHRKADGTSVTYMDYTCWRARHDAAHPRPLKVAESVLLSWIKEEAARYGGPMAVEMEERTPASGPSREDLMARRQRVIDNYEDGLIGRDERTAKVAAIDDEMERLDSLSWSMEELPEAIDWDNDPPDAINAVLRALWRSVRLDESLRPMEADWRVPKWRTEA